MSGGGQDSISVADGILATEGLADRAGFDRYHEVLSEARWDGRALARKLRLNLLDVLLPKGEVVIVPDDSIERRWPPHPRPRHLPQPGALLARLLCQNQRSALAVAGGGAADPV